MIQDLIKSLSDSITEPIDKSKFSAFYNLFILPAAQMISPLDGRISAIEQFQGLLSPLSLTDNEMDVIASNFLVFRSQGSTGYAQVSLVVKGQQAVNIPDSLILSITINSIQYQFTCVGTTYQSSDFVSNTQYGNYYSSNSTFQVVIPADATLDYTKVPLNSVLTPLQTVDSNIVYFILTSISVPAVQTEDNPSLYRRLLNTAGSNTLDNFAGVQNIFAQNFPDVPVVAVYGNTDSEVTRNQFLVYSSNPLDQTTVLDFKGKVTGNLAVPHTAYEYLMTVSGQDYTLTGSRLVPTGYINYITSEISDEEYAGLQSPVSASYFVSGFGVLLEATNFVVDANWILSDEYMGPGSLMSATEITISGNDYLLGSTIQTYDVHQFVLDLVNSTIGQ